MVYPCHELFGTEGNGSQHNQYEYMWWVVIPTMFVIWFMMNYKIEKRWLVGSFGGH